MNRANLNRMRELAGLPLVEGLDVEMPTDDAEASPDVGTDLEGADDVEGGDDMAVFQSAADAIDELISSCEGSLSGDGESNDQEMTQTSDLVNAAKKLRDLLTQELGTGEPTDVEGGEGEGDLEPTTDQAKQFKFSFKR